MVMSRIFTAFLLVSVAASLYCHSGSALAAAVLQGAQSGITLAISLSGALCLWSGVGALLEAVGITRTLACILRPLLSRLFPSTRTDPILAGSLSGNLCANFLGLGNAATPMGIAAAKRLKDPSAPETATDELCRLIVLNTASIQLIPTSVAAVRAGLGCATPFDILPAVWLTSLCSAGFGVGAAYLIGKAVRHG